MNALLQALYFTPGFLKLLFSWQFQRREEESEAQKQSEEQRRKRSIPLQLQYLFSRLKLSSKKKVDTKALTTSFGWDGNEAHEQQDIQVFLYIYFDFIFHI